MNYMTKKQAEAEFLDSYGEYIKQNKNDRPARQLAWASYVDGLNKCNRISDNQRATWDNPKFAK